MDKDAFLEAIKKIGTTEDITEIRTQLTELSDKVVEVFDSNVTLTEQNSNYQKDIDSYKEDMEKLRSANMKLFLRVGSEKTEKEIIKSKTGVDEEENQPRKFEDLFNEKGGLK